MDHNPYLPPRATLTHEPLHGLGRGYVVANLAYLVLLGICGILLVASGPPPLDSRTVEAALYFWAPVLVFAMLRWGPVRHRGKALVAYSAFVLALVVVFAWNLLGPQPDILIGTLIVSINVIGLGSALRQPRAGHAHGTAGACTGGSTER